MGYEETRGGDAENAPNDSARHPVNEREEQITLLQEMVPLSSAEAVGITDPAIRGVVLFFISMMRNSEIKSEKKLPVDLWSIVFGYAFGLSSNTYKNKIERLLPLICHARNQRTIDNRRAYSTLFAISPATRRTEKKHTTCSCVTM